jgi:hypothetical protein
MVSFTCGHVFPKRGFYEHLLLEFQAQVEAMPIAIPTTLKLILADYHQKLINLACPYCVYQALRQEQLKVKPNVKIQEWKM